MLLIRSNIVFLLSMVLSLGCAAVAHAIVDTEPEPLHSRVDLSDKHTGLTILSVQNNTDLLTDPLIRTPKDSIPWIEYGGATGISVFFKDKWVPSGLIFRFVPPVNTVLIPGIYQGIGRSLKNSDNSSELIIITDEASSFNVRDDVRWNFEIMEIRECGNF